MRFPHLLTALLALPAALFPLLSTAQINVVQTVAPNVYFHEGDVGRKGHCNNGWIVFADYVLVIDGNFPSGAREVIPKIKALTDRPIRFAFDTHHHGDHAYGNQVWHEAGAIPVAHVGVLEEFRRHEASHFGTGKSGRWDDAAKGRPDVAASRLKIPTLLFKQDLYFDDGTNRVELLHFGVAHTHGDGFAWLPKEKILFTGDACVNGPYNYVGDGNVGDWIKTLQAARKLGPKVICPGHGPMGGPEILDDQIDFFVTLQTEVKNLVAANKQPAEAKAAVDAIKARIKANDRLLRYVGGGFAGQVETAYVELGGKPFPK